VAVDPTFYRPSDDPWAAAGALSAGERERRAVLALGPAPLDDARHLLPPVALPDPPAPAAVHPAGGLAPGPHPATEFVIDLLGAAPVSAERTLGVITWVRRAALGFPRLWGHLPGPERWVAPEEVAGETALTALVLCRDLTGLLSEGTEAARELGALAAAAASFASALGRTAAPRDTPEAGARRAALLLSLRARFGRSVEMRLMPAGRPFPARNVWRAAYALGLRWGDLDLFHWHGALPADARPLFTLSAVGQPGFFLPERAAEGEGVNGIALGFELPRSPAPLEVYDRMALALAFLRQKLGGHPTTAGGRELDGDRLDEERDDLATLVADMAAAGIAPGSPESARLF
jgi:cell division protein ZipA